MLEILMFGIGLIIGGLVGWSLGVKWCQDVFVNEMKKKIKDLDNG